MSNNADARIRSFIERILRMKAEQDAIGADIREIYKEAAGEGFNKTAIGKVVTLIRAREKDADKMAALDADVALYLGAYDGTGIAPTRMRAIPAPTQPDEFDPATGEVFEPTATEPPAAIPAAPETEPSEPSSDAVLPAGESRSSQSGQGLDPIPVQSHIVREPNEPKAKPPAEIDLDIPASLRRDPVTNRAPWMDKVAAE